MPNRVSICLSSLPNTQSKTPVSRAHRNIMKTKFLKAALCLFLTGASSLVQAQVLDKSPLVHLSFDKIATNGTTTNVINEGTGGTLMNGVMNSSASGGATIVPGGR